MTRRAAPVPGRSAGFTLLELLIATALLALVSAMAYGGLNSLLRSNEQVEQRLARFEALRFAINQLTTDLQQAVLRPVNDPLGQIEPALVVDPQDLHRFDFTHLGWLNPLGRTRGTAQRVSYRLEGTDWVRIRWLVLDAQDDGAAVRDTVLAGVDRFEVRVLDFNNAWHRSWPLPQMPPDALPKVVEVTLLLPDLGEITRLVELPR